MMIDYFDAAIYGVIQGLTEFLPVSSSGHLALLPHFLGVDDPGVAFDLAMHLGTALAVILYYFKDLISLVDELKNFIFRKKTSDYFALNLIISTISTLFIVLLIKDYASHLGRSVEMISYNLIGFGFLMWVSDAFFPEKESGQMNRQLQVKKAICIGLFQGLAVFPGVSRSGGTLTISRFFKLSKDEAAKYSFLLSLPIIIGGALLKAPELLSQDQSIDLSACLFGIFISFVVGLLTIHFFLKVIKKVGLGAFSLYRILFAIYLLWQF